MTGKRFGKLKVLRAVEATRGGPSTNRGVRWLCRCDCGGESVAYGFNLRSGNTTSCGCLRGHRPARKR
jgi:hypothetical protein